MGLGTKERARRVPGRKACETERGALERTRGEGGQERIRRNALHHFLHASARARARALTQDRKRLQLPRPPHTTTTAAAMTAKAAAVGHAGPNASRASARHNPRHTCASTCGNACVGRAAAYAESMGPDARQGGGQIARSEASCNMHGGGRPAGRR